MPGTMLKLPALPKREDSKVPRSQTERLWLIGGGLVGFLLILIGYFMFISPQRSQTSDVNTRVATAQEQNARLRARLDALQQQQKNLPKYTADLVKARLALPAASGVPDFLRSLQALGTATHTNVTAVTFGQPTPVVPVAPAASTASPSASPSASTASAGSSAPAAAAPATSLFSIPITGTVTGSIGALENFLDQLQTVQPRAVLISQITESAGLTTAGGKAAATDNATIQLSMQAFVSPEAAAAAPTAAPSAGSH